MTVTLTISSDGLGVSKARTRSLSPAIGTPRISDEFVLG
jgi:hypothetical protein